MSAFNKRACPRCGAWIPRTQQPKHSAWHLEQDDLRAALGAALHATDAETLRAALDEAARILSQEEPVA